MHDQTFPDSSESPERRSNRALESLKYEDKAGLGWRRRARSGLGNPWADPSEHQVGREPTQAQLWANFIAGLGAALGGAAIFYKPLVLGLVGVLLALVGAMAGGPAARTGKIAIAVATTGAVLGLLLSIFATGGAIW